MDPDQTALMRRLVLIHAGRKPIMLVLSWHGSYWAFCIHMKWEEKLQDDSTQVFYIFDHL
jgi:hypothetical protein